MLSLSFSPAVVLLSNVLLLSSFSTNITPLANGLSIPPARFLVSDNLAVEPRAVDVEDLFNSNDNERRVLGIPSRQAASQRTSQESEDEDDQDQDEDDQDQDQDQDQDEDDQDQDEDDQDQDQDPQDPPRNKNDQNEETEISEPKKKNNDRKTKHPHPQDHDPDDCDDESRKDRGNCPPKHAKPPA